MTTPGPPDARERLDQAIKDVSADIQRVDNIRSILTGRRNEHAKLGQEIASRAQELRTAQEDLHLRAKELREALDELFVMPAEGGGRP